MKLYNLNISFRLGNDIHHITVSAPDTSEKYANSEILSYMKAHELTGTPQLISITCNKGLKELLEEVQPTFTPEECDEKFTQIADQLLHHYAIRKGNTIYRMTDIEFYYYDPQLKDERKAKQGEKAKRITYERTTPAGCWFFHQSGIDISFQSHKKTNEQDTEDYGGGILIRGIQQIEPTIEDPIDGSLRTYWKLFDEHVDAFSDTVQNPHLTPYTFDSLPEIKKGQRHGLKDKEQDGKAKLWSFKSNTKK